MTSVVDSKTYLSPKHKLLSCFKKGRDGWKRRCSAAKKKSKALTNNVAALRESRERWKALARQRRDEIRQLRRELEQAKNPLS
jgi:predicted  nucleic acid-binding Zn-ribbon protein